MKLGENTDISFVYKGGGGGAKAVWTLKKNIHFGEYRHP